VDSTTLEANAAMKSIVRRDTGESYVAYLKRLAEAEGIDAQDAASLLRMDRKRKKKTSNEDWNSPSDKEAEITKLKRWAHGAGLQSRERGGHGNRRHCCGHHARRSCGGHGDGPGNRDGRR